nr:retrovirus-related Pol polyprotein from transposon TNT 1-94 [Tanacetum cinerariifolium]
SDDELKKITALLSKAFNRKKFYSKPTNNNLRTSSVTSSANKKQEYVKSDDKKEKNKVDEKKRDISKVKCYNCKKKGHVTKDCKKAKVKDYEYYKTKMLLAKKDKDEQVLLAEDHAWMESSSDSDQKINANMVSYYTSESKSKSEYETSNYYDNSTTYGLFVDNNDDQEIFHDSSENFSENLIKSQIDHNESGVTHNDSKDVAKKQIADQEILFDKMSRQLVEFDENVRMLENTVLEKDLKIYVLEECVHNKDLEIEKCLERLNECNRALLTNFVVKFLGTVRFGNNDFAVISSYGDVVIGSMTMKKVYYVEGLGHNLFSVGQFCDKGLEVTFQKSTCFVRNKDGVDLVTGDRSLNLYTIALNEITSNSLACLLAKASSSQSWLWHQCLSHLNFATINNLVKNNLVRGLPKMKFKKDHLCFACEQGKIHQKHHRSKMAFASNKPLYLRHMDLCGLMRVESINRKRYVLVVVNDYSWYIWVFFLYSKDEASEVIISFIKKTQVNLQLQVQRVRTDNGTEFKNKTLAKFFDELKAKGDFGVFVGYSKDSAAFRVYNK